MSREGCLRISCVIFILMIAILVVPVFAVEKGPVGPDMVQRLDLLPYLFTGGQAMHTSSHHPMGGNSDCGIWLYTSGEDQIIFDDKGPGCITRMWFTNRYGTEKPLLFGNVRIYVDGSLLYNGRLTEYPGDGIGVNNVITGGMLSRSYNNAFHYPMVGNRDDSSGGFYCYTPIAYASSCKIVVNYIAQPLYIGYYYNIDYIKYDSADGIRTFQITDDLTSAWTLWENTRVGKENVDPKQPASTTQFSNLGSPKVISVGQTGTLCTLAGPASISAIKLKLNGGVNTNNDFINKLVMKISYDGRPADVRCILGHFFGTDLYWPNRWDAAQGRYVLADVNGLLFGINGSSRWLYNFFPMPFGSSASIAIENNSTSSVSVEYIVQTSPMPDAARLLQTGQIGYFCSTQNTGYTNSVWQEDYHLANITGRGKIVGMVYSPKSYNNEQSYLEGDERIFIDGSRTPVIRGTGTEDTFNGGWYMKWGTFTQPTHGYTTRIVGAYSGSVITQIDNVSLYRLFIGDSIPFNSGIKFDFEYGEFDNLPPRRWNGVTYVTDCGSNRTGCLDYCSQKSTVFYYLAATPPALVQSDVVDVGNISSEAAHEYSMGVAGNQPVTKDMVFQVTWRSPNLVENGREFSGSYSQFIINVAPVNYGVKLRRLMNYNIANQEAVVKVDGETVGTWYDPGNITYTDGNNYLRAWRDSDFDIPARYTQNRPGNRITVRIEPVGNWTEYAYYAYSLVAPQSVPPAPGVSDEGSLTSSQDSLAFTITPPDEPVWGIDDYSYAIGTTPGAVDVRDWTSIGKQTSFTASGLQLQPGYSYYISVKAKNGLGGWSSPAATDGIAKPIQVESVSDAKDTGSGRFISLEDVVVTENFGDFFYIEQKDRSCGIRVSGVQAVSRGDRRNVAGLLKVDANGEKYIEAASVDTSPLGTTFDIKPVGLSEKAVGGGPTPACDIASGTGQRGVWAYHKSSALVQLTGTNNIGLLIKVFGRVTWTDEQDGCFYVDDGSGFNDYQTLDAQNGMPAGVKVRSYNGAGVPIQGSYVTVTGISSMYKAVDETYRRCIIVSQAEDIRTVSQ